MAAWDPAIYERYKAQRDRPALDLLLRIPGDLNPTEIWDLGCGAGEHAAVLAARHPKARVHGLDSSQAMLEKARRRPAEVDWRQGDIAAFAPDVAPDLIFTNAALQWVPDHAGLIPKLAASLAPGGVFACQAPMSRHGRWRELLRQTAAQPRFAAAAAGVWDNLVHGEDDYHGWLAPLCPGGVDIWSTEYWHTLQGDDPVLEWIRGAALIPYLAAMPNDAERDAFEDDLAAKLRDAYPAREDGVTLLPFRRLFIVARR